MTSSLNKLNKSMMEMKEKALASSYETIADLKNQLKNALTKKPTDLKDQETLEQLKAKCHSLAFLNKQQEDTILMLKESVKKLENEFEELKLQYE